MQDVYRPDHKKNAKKVVDKPVEATAPKRKKTSRKGQYLALFVFVAAMISAAFFLQHKQTVKHAEEVAAQKPARFDEKPKKGILKTYTSEQFSELYNNFAYPNTQRISEETPITGNRAADDHIRGIAVGKGYKVRSAPVADTFKTVAPDMKLQERAAQPWLDMQAAAKKDKVLISLTAAYRSAEDQRAIFLSRLKATNVAIDSIPSGRFDTQINNVLGMTALPGYSRHHNGYTIDIGCDSDPSVVFEESVCFKWLSAENYKHTKEHGWIPSYPPESEKQGPDPESWEYVWVGVDTLTE